MTLNDRTDKNYTRRDFLSVAMTVPILLSGLDVSAFAKEGFSIASPNGQVEFFLASKSQLSYRVSLKNRTVVEPSRIGIVIDGTDLGTGAEIKKLDGYRANEKYAWRGVHSEAVDRFRGARIRATHPASRTDFTIDVRVFNDGVAFRYLVPRNNDVRVPDEATTFTLPANSTSWFHDFYGHYEGTHQRKKIEDVKDGEWAAPPVTFELPDGSGYVAITEAALVNYPAWVCEPMAVTVFARCSATPFR
jgi:alpha-glucosidase